ncbi:MAG: threonine synthase [Desulfurococcales archaeon]|nr:threonine synthase [Desulfurococcales archaeon]
MGGFDEDSMRLKCIECGSTYRPDPWLFRCPKCGGLLDVEYRHKIYRLDARERGVWRFKSMLPNPKTRVSLGEGDTPLIEAKSLPVSVKSYIKFEGSNPTGSFKDRGMAVAVSLAKSMGAKAVIAASTGNTSASASAYAARAGLKPIVVLPRGRVARGKLFQAVLHGAFIIEVEGSFDVALESVIEATGGGSRLFYPVNSFNPWRLEGQKTLAYEVYSQLGRVPDYVVVPVGNAGNIWAIWKGFKELKDAGVVDETPVMIGVQAQGAAPIASMVSRSLEEPLWIDKPETIATAIRIGRPINWRKAVIAIRESGGTVVAVDDREILEAQRMLARVEGVGVEPASAASLAGLLKLDESGYFEYGSHVVMVATGHALKDPEVPLDIEPVRASGLQEVVSLLRGLIGD